VEDVIGKGSVKVKSQCCYFNLFFLSLTTEKDADRLREALPNVKRHKSLENYNHVDFNYGKNSRKLFFGDVLKAMNTE
jgi:hypothetical protein